MLFPATVLLETDAYIREFLVRSGLNGPMATSELHYRLGQDLLERQPGCEEYSVVAARGEVGVPIYTSSPGDSSIGMNVACHELMNGSTLMIDPNLDVNEVCAIILAGTRNGCVILGGGSPKNFYLQAQPTLWEVYGIPKGGNDYFIQITTDQVVWGGLSGATPSEAVSWGKVNPGVLPDTVVAYCDIDDRVPALLRIRRRQSEQPPPAQASSSIAAPSSSRRSSAKPRRRATIRVRTGKNERGTRPSAHGRASGEPLAWGKPAACSLQPVA